MCIDTEYFITEADKLSEHICPIGKGVIVDPVFLNCDQTIHIFCKECFDNYEKSLGYHKNCPVCRSTYKKIPIIPYYENIIKLFELKCHNEGCTWSGTVEQFRVHTTSCEHKIVKCTNLSCDVELPLPKLNAHLDSCPYTIIDCALCQRKYKRKDEAEHTTMSTCSLCENEYNACIFTKHQSLCDFKLLKCIWCHIEYKKIDEVDHKKNHCLERSVKCEHCKDSYKYKDKSKDYNKKHFENLSCEHCSMVIAGCMMRSK